MIQAITFSEAGGHLINEDAFAVQQHPDDPDCWICTLSDGQGGRSGGGRASQLGCAKVMELARQQRPNDLLRSNHTWATIFCEADTAVAAESAAGFATLIGFCVTGAQIHGASNGDSAVAIFNESRQCVELTGRQIKNPPIGSGHAAFMPFNAALNGPWMVLTMSDGVWKYSRWDRIKEAARHLRGQELVEELLQYARLPQSGQLQDDFTLVVLQTNNE